MIEKLKAASNTKPNLMAGAIAGIITDGNQVEIDAIGAIAINQTVKAVAIAKKFLEEKISDLRISPEFAAIEIEGKELTMLKLHVHAMHADGNKKQH